MIEAGGRTLSGGQRQQIVNLRALLSGRKMLILDEAFASLDVETVGSPGKKALGTVPVTGDP